VIIINQWIVVRGAARVREWAIATAAAMIAAATFLTPAVSEAAVYKWKVNGGGTWTDPANWERVSGNPCVHQFPNCVGDEVVLPSTLTARSVIDIPANVTITIGAISAYNSQFVSIRGDQLAHTSKLVFATSTGGPALLRHFGGENGDLYLDVGIEVQSNITVMTSLNTMVLLDEVSESGRRTMTKVGAGMLVFGDDVTQSGGTRVEDGALDLSGANGSSYGRIEIGDGVGNAESAQVFVTNRANTSDIVVNKDGLLSIFNSADIGPLVVNDGVVRLNAARQVRVGDLKMTGGLLFAAVAGGVFSLKGEVTATASQSGPARMEGVNDTAKLELDTPATLRIFSVNDGPGDVDLHISLPVTGLAAGLLKEGAGVLRFTGSASNTYPGDTRVRAGRLDLARNAGAIAIPGRLEIGPAPAAEVRVVTALVRQNIADTATVSIGSGGLLTVSGDETIGSLTVDPGGRVVIEPHANDRTANLRTTSLSMLGGRITVDGALYLEQKLMATSSPTEMATLDGSSGTLPLSGDLDIDVANGPQAIDLRIDPRFVSTGNVGLTKRGAGVVQLGGANSYKGATTILEGALLVTRQISLSQITATGGTLGGNARIGKLIAAASTIAPGLSPGRLTTDAVTLGPDTTLSMELNDMTPGTGYDQLDVNGTVNLGGARLSIVPGFTPAPRASFTLVVNDGTDPVVGTFAGLAEGAKVKVAARDLTISYRGGDGNDVVLADMTPDLSYYLAEGATGPFFDNDVLIANPNDREAPVTMTFLREGGSTVVARRTVPAFSRLTVHVDQITDLEDASASVQVTSDNHLPLVVERTMFWDASYYGGHTANAVAQPETRWIFAEGFQGFFDTYILIANANAEETTATITFLREGDTPVVATVPVGAFARKTIQARDYPEVVGRAFGIIVEATRPVIAERAMYFETRGDQFWIGGHVNTGIVAPSTSWFHAEGATGSYFNTFILLSNPQDTPANVELRFLLDTGDVITRTKTLAAKQRLTVNPAAEGDTRLQDAALSTVVQSDVPIVSERSMYWAENEVRFGEGHNSTGLASTATRWGLAEGRLGGPREFATFILLANPSATEAQVTITYLRESGEPVVKTYTVPPTSRFNVDVKDMVPELRETSFGARIEVTNNVPIAVERSLYWNANGVFWAGGTNALGTPLP
jgi:autotransporter-associated beta strand protein